jgi:hypothetical protein
LRAFLKPDLERRDLLVLLWVGMPGFLYGLELWRAGHGPGVLVEAWGWGVFLSLSAFISGAVWEGRRRRQVLHSHCVEVAGDMLNRALNEALNELVHTGQIQPGPFAMRVPTTKH